MTAIRAGSEKVANVMSALIIALLLAASVGIVTTAAKKADAAPVVPVTQPAPATTVAVAGPEMSCPAPTFQGGTSLAMAFAVEGDTAGLTDIHVDFGDSSSTPVPAAGTPISHVYDHPGAYLVVMSAVDHSGATVTRSCMTDWVLDVNHS